MDDSAHKPRTNAARPLRILIAGVSGSEYCGVQQYAETLAGELNRSTTRATLCWLPANSGRRDFRVWLTDVRRADSMDVTIVQYSVFALSWRGIPTRAVSLARALRSSGRPAVTVLHEFAFPWGRRGWRGFIHAATQRIALVAIMWQSSELIVTTEARSYWLRSRWYLPRRRVSFAPVFSTICDRPPVKVPAASGRVVVFGWSDDWNRRDVIADAVAKASSEERPLELLMVGAPGARSSQAAAWRDSATRAGCGISFTGPLSDDALADTLACAAVAVFPDRDGPSSRRTTLAALLAQGCPTIAFEGPEVWRSLVEEGAVELVAAEPEALAAAILRLTRDAGAATSRSNAARRFYERRLSRARAANVVLGAASRATAGAYGG